MSSPSETEVLKSELFDDFTETELTSLQSVLIPRQYKKGEIILQEGAMDEDIYLLKSGVVDVVKFTGKSQQVVEEISGETLFGDQAFLDGSPRSATIRAQDDTRVFILRKKAIMEIPNKGDLLNKLYRNIAMINSMRLKHSASSYAVTMEKKINLLQEKNYFDQFIITILITYSITLVVTSLMYNFFKNINIFSQSFTWFYLVLLVTPFIYFVSKSGAPWADFGVTTKNWKKSAIEGTLFSLGMIGVVFVGLLAVGQMGYLDLNSLTLQELTKNLGPESLLYFFHSYGQEFVARGVFQNAFQRFLSDKSGLRSVIMTSWLFGLSHILYGPELVTVTLISGVFFGLIFLRHQNLLGVTIVHFMMGMLAFSVPSLPFEGQL